MNEGNCELICERQKRARKKKTTKKKKKRVVILTIKTPSRHLNGAQSSAQVVLIFNT